MKNIDIIKDKSNSTQSSAQVSLRAMGNSTSNSIEVKMQNTEQVSKTQSTAVIKSIAQVTSHSIGAKQSVKPTNVEKYTTKLKQVNLKLVLPRLLSYKVLELRLLRLSLMY